MDRIVPIQLGLLVRLQVLFFLKDRQPAHKRRRIEAEIGACDQDMVERLHQKGPVASRRHRGQPVSRGPHPAHLGDHRVHKRDPAIDRGPFVFRDLLHHRGVKLRRGMGRILRRIDDRGRSTASHLAQQPVRQHSVERRRPAAAIGPHTGHRGRDLPRCGDGLHQPRPVRIDRRVLQRHRPHGHGLHPIGVRHVDRIMAACPAHRGHHLRQHFRHHQMTKRARPLRLQQKQPRLDGAKTKPHKRRLSVRPRHPIQRHT